MASQLGIGNTLRPPASYALAVLQESSCGSSPSAGHVIHSLPRLGATEQNSGCCCKISGRKLFSHSFQWFSFRPVSAVISQKTLIYFVQSPTPFLCLLPCRDIFGLPPDTCPSSSQAIVIKSAVPVTLWNIKGPLSERRIALIPCTSECVYQSDGLCTLDSAAAAGVPALGGACVHFIPAKRLESPHRYSERAEAANPGSSPALDGPESRSV